MRLFFCLKFFSSRGLLHHDKTTTVLNFNFVDANSRGRRNNALNVNRATEELRNKTVRRGCRGRGTHRVGAFVLSVKPAKSQYFIIIQ